MGPRVFTIAYKSRSRNDTRPIVNTAIVVSDTDVTVCEGILSIVGGILRHKTYWLVRDIYVGECARIIEGVRAYD